MSDHYVISSMGESEYVDRKSRFIGHVMPIAGEAEALALIEQFKRKYWDARHNCYAYITGDNGEISRSSDDGEPSGTAGRPILECLIAADLNNALAIVTRYFGGTLLGTGGLVRAYTQATKEAIAHAALTHMRKAGRISVTAEYNCADRIRRYIDTLTDARIEDTIYTDTVELIITAAEDILEQTLDDITGLSTGHAHIRVIENGYYAL